MSRLTEHCNMSGRC